MAFVLRGSGLKPAARVGKRGGRHFARRALNLEITQALDERGAGSRSGVCRC